MDADGELLVKHLTNDRFGSTAAVLHQRERVSFTPAGRQSDNPPAQLMVLSVPEH